MPTPINETLSDVFSLSDSVALRLGTPVSRFGGDNLFLSDSAQFLVSLLSKPSDQLSLSDRLQIQRSIALSFVDVLALADSAGAPILIVEIDLLFSDSLSLSDSPSVMPSTGLDEYLRRYLNDVA